MIFSAKPVGNETQARIVAAYSSRRLGDTVMRSGASSGLRNCRRHGDIELDYQALHFEVAEAPASANRRRKY